MAPGFLSPWHIAILVLVVLLVFGPSRLPEMGRGLGRGMREFKDSLAAPTNEDEVPHLDMRERSVPGRDADE